MNIIVGLGNPGAQYRHTRHNVGFMVLDRLADQLGAAFTQEKYGGLIGKSATSTGCALLIKPLSYMNNSGECVARALRYTESDPADLLVVADDVNLPLGKLRIRPEGSAGGHNGLQSIIDHLGAQDFPRLRLGVGQREAGQDLVGHVLGTFSMEEQPLRDEMVARAVDAVRAYLADGIERAMSAFN